MLVGQLAQHAQRKNGEASLLGLLFCPSELAFPIQTRRARVALACKRIQHAVPCLEVLRLTLLYEACQRTRKASSALGLESPEGMIVSRQSSFEGALSSSSWSAGG